MKYFAGSQYFFYVVFSSFLFAFPINVALPEPWFRIACLWNVCYLFCKKKQCSHICSVLPPPMRLIKLISIVLDLKSLPSLPHLSSFTPGNRNTLLTQSIMSLFISQSCPIHSMTFHKHWVYQTTFPKQANQIYYHSLYR